MNELPAKFRKLPETEMQQMAANRCATAEEGAELINIEFLKE
jgi:hypothetical protein